ncbi:MAG TPA: hypothetical protein PLE24_05780 [Chitinispirillaceae bacterium]|nr:hypothetical protein [Chitinispirillaceae bacterium]
MSHRLRQYLLDAYESRHTLALPARISADVSIQIDDQDENDKLNEFCNIFCIVKKRDNFRIELSGNFPITQEISDLVDIYEGSTDSVQGRLVLELNVKQIEVIMDLADKIRKTSFMGPRIHNPNWLSISARTISSLYRFVRIVKEYMNSKGS